MSKLPVRTIVAAEAGAAGLRVEGERASYAPELEDGERDRARRWLQVRSSRWHFRRPIGPVRCSRFQARRKYVPGVFTFTALIDNVRGPSVRVDAHLAVQVRRTSLAWD